MTPPRTISDSVIAAGRKAAGQPYLSAKKLSAIFLAMKAAEAHERPPVVGKITEGGEARFPDPQ